MVPSRLECGRWPGSGRSKRGLADGVAAAWPSSVHSRSVLPSAPPETITIISAEKNRVTNQRRELEAVAGRPGLARAKEQGTQLGRRRLEDTDAGKVAAIRRARTKGAGIRKIARDLGVGVGTVLRVTGEA